MPGTPPLRMHRIVSLSGVSEVWNRSTKTLVWCPWTRASRRVQALVQAFFDRPDAVNRVDPPVFAAVADKAMGPRGITPRILQQMKTNTEARCLSVP